MEITSDRNFKDSNLFAALKLIFLLYLFFLSLELMGTGMKLFGAGFSKMLIETTTNPFIGLFIGILATSIIQSSSSTTSMVVAMVASGAFSNDPEISIALAIPIIMGANIGTSITNILVSLPQIRRDNEFKRAFSAAIVHDFFNILCVLVLFPIQLATNFLGYLATELELVFKGAGGLNFLSPVKLITKPVAKLIESQLKMFIGDESIIGWIVVILALLLLFLALKFMVDVLKSLVIEKAKAWFDNYLFKNALRAFAVGTLLTVLVQSSSITTSLVVPMAGAGILTLTQIYPYTLGANIGTTITAMLAALVTGNDAAITVAFSHLLFNASGTAIFMPLKRIPIFMAEKFAEYSIRNKYIPVAYIIVVFFIIPLIFIFIFN
ncbi:MAG: Na/Pi symporter [Melioribacteraceae bacterium]|nr:Na/Pi symporter [Melioribacteraceae bacterium]